MKKEQMLMLLVSPLIALYGIIPVYLFSQIPFNNIVVSYLALTLMIILFWWANNKLFRTSLPSMFKYLISYLVSLSIHLGILFLTPILSGAQMSSTFIVYPLISTLAINSIILIIIRMQLIKQDKDSMELELGSVKLENLEAQKSMLTQQLQPHFLFNALSTLKSLIAIDGPKAVQYTLSLSEFLRYTSQAGVNNIVSVKEELEFMKDYLDLQKTRFETSLQYSVEIADGLLECKLPVFAIQSLVENAIKHNALSERKPLEVLIYSKENLVIVSNRKQTKPLQSPSGTGLQNLKNRYQLMFGKSIEVIDDTESFTVKIPVICQ